MDGNNLARQQRNRRDLYGLLGDLEDTASDPIAFLRWELNRISRRNLTTEDRTRIVAEFIHHGVSDEMVDLYRRFEEDAALEAIC